jgi:glutathione S-transferase
MQLVIGDKTFSSWSLRPWLVLKHLGLDFEETSIRLRQPDTAADAARFSPSGKVPVLRDGDVTTWDSLAICEYLAERHPDLWPANAADRAEARSVCAEMHGGFPSIRGELSMDLGLTHEAEISEATRIELQRIVRLWSSLRERHAAAGPFLFGAWSIADAYFTPVATRLRTHGVTLGDYGDAGAAATYSQLLLAQPELKEWEEGAAAERAARE